MPNQPFPHGGDVLLTSFTAGPEDYALAERIAGYRQARTVCVANRTNLVGLTQCAVQDTVEMLTKNTVLSIDDRWTSP